MTAQDGLLIEQRLPQVIYASFFAQITGGLNDTDPQEGTETALSDRLGRALFSLNDTDPQEGTETFYLCDGQAVIQLS